MKNQLTISFFVLLVLLLWTCRKEVICDDPTVFSCPNFDPCTLVVPADAGFEILDFVEFMDTTFMIEIDTVLNVKQPLFRANERSSIIESYAWKIGSDARTFTEPEFDLLFADYEGHIDVQLTTTAQDWDGCLTESEATATTNQSFYVSDLTTYQTQVWGDYKGSNIGNESEEYTINLVGFVSDYYDSRFLSGITLPNDCEAAAEGIPLSGGYDFFVSAFVRRNGNRRCRDLTVIGKLSKDNRDELTIDYWYDADDGSRHHEQFVGYRE